MSRRAVAVFVLVSLGVASLPGEPGARAAPEPKHLMPKDPPLTMPTRVGTTWVYDVDGKEQTFTISKVEEKNGAKFVTTELVSAEGRRSHHMTKSIGPTGVFLVAEGGSTYGSAWCIFKLPHKEGTRWETGHGPAMVAGPIEKVKVPAGEFLAARVEWGAGADKATYWYAHAVGLVWMEGNPTWKLKSFTPGKE